MAPAALVTGGSRGIGFSLAEELAKRGYDLILAALNEERLQQSSQKLARKHEVNTDYISIDLSEPEAAQSLYDNVAQRDVSVEILINNAGFGGAGRFDRSPLPSHQQMLQLNVNTLMELTHLFVNDMLQRPGIPSYIMNVSISTLCPGPTSTDFHEQAGTSGRIISNSLLSMDPDRVAKTGIDKMLNGKSLIVPGIMNKLGVVGASLLPHTLLIKTVQLLHQRSE